MPFVIIVGIFGNVLSLLVFMGTHLRKESLSVYLSALAIAHTGCLLAIFISWLDVWKVTVFHRNGLCQLTVYFTYVCSFLSIWYVVCYMVERYVVVCYPLKRVQLCTTYRAKIVTSTIAGIGLVGYFLTLWITGVRNIGDQTLCIHVFEYIETTTILTYIDGFLALVTPLVILIGTNAMILRKITLFYRGLKQNELSNKRHYVVNVRGKKRVVFPKTKQIRVTKIMLTISSVFVLITLPSYVIKIRLIILSFGSEAYVNKPEEFLVQSAFEFIYYINFSINFFLYVIFLKRFRIALKRIIRHCAKKACLYKLFRKCHCCYGYNSTNVRFDVSGLKMVDHV